MASNPSFSSEEARLVGDEIGIDWAAAPFDVEQFRMGMGVELEHGVHDPTTNVTDSDLSSPGRSPSRTSRSSPTTTRVSRAWKRRLRPNSVEVDRPAMRMSAKAAATLSSASLG